MIKKSILASIITLFLLFTLLLNSSNTIAHRILVKTYLYGITKFNNSDKIRSEIEFNNDKTNHLNFDIDVSESEFKKLINNSKLYSESGITTEQYQENNKWLKCKIAIDNKKYKAKIKAHGATPWHHFDKDNNIMSLKIKLKNSNFLNRKTLLLIIYARVEDKNSLTGLLANTFNLPHVTFNPVTSYINGEKFNFILEEKVNKNFLNNHGFKNSVIIETAQNKTPLYCLSTNNTRLQRKFSKADFEQIEANHSRKLALKFESFNKILTTQNSDSLFHFIDSITLARFNLLRSITGGGQHGFNTDNFILIYDTISEKFTPLIHRDYSIMLLNKNQNITSQLNYEVEEWDSTKFEYKNKFGSLISTNSEITKLTSELKSTTDFEALQKSLDSIIVDSKSQLRSPYIHRLLDIKTKDYFPQNTENYNRLMNNIKVIREQL